MPEGITELAQGEFAFFIIRDEGDGSSADGVDITDLAMPTFDSIEQELTKFFAPDLVEYVMESVRGAARRGCYGMCIDVPKVKAAYYA